MSRRMIFLNLCCTRRTKKRGQVHSAKKIDNYGIFHLSAYLLVT